MTATKHEAAWNEAALNEFELVIRAQRTGIGLPLSELWESGEILYFLVWRSMKVRYKQAVVGAGWAIIKPLMLMVVFVTVFGLLIRVPTGDIPYSLVVYTGILPWTLVSTVLGSAATSLITESALLARVYFPRLLAPLSASLVALVDLLVSLPLLFGVMYWFGIPLTPRALLLPLFVGMIFVLALSMGIVLSALQVRYHDVGLLLPVLLQIWMYASPIVYPITLVPERYMALYSLNPMVGLLQGLRWALLDVSPPTGFMLATGIVFPLLMLVAGVVFFNRFEDTFVDHV